MGRSTPRSGGGGAAQGHPNQSGSARSTTGSRGSRARLEKAPKNVSTTGVEQGILSVEDPPEDPPEEPPEEEPPGGKLGNPEGSVRASTTPTERARAPTTAAESVAEIVILLASLNLQPSCTIRVVLLALAPGRYSLKAVEMANVQWPLHWLAENQR